MPQWASLCRRLCLGLLAVWGWVPPGIAAKWQLPPGSSAEALQAMLDEAGAGDTVVVAGGQYDGPFTIDKQLVVVGRDGATLDGHGAGTVLKVTGPGAVVRGFTIRGSGGSLNRENSGVAVEAPGVSIEDNRLEDTLFGIYLRKADHAVIRGNRIRGKDLAVPRRGDPIRVWYSNGVRIEDNDVARGRDVVLWYSEDLEVRRNLVQDGRYGLHFMYCDDALIVSNRLTGNSVGAFLMYSRRLRMVRNAVVNNRGPSGYGIGLKDMDDAVVEDTLFVGNRVGAYVDNSPRELDSTTRFTGCLFAYNDVGIRLLPLVRRNTFLGNSFVANLEQVAVTGGGRLEGNTWSRDGRGNYWSDYAGYDADGDGVGDLPYRAEKYFEHLVDARPVFRLFANGPAAAALDFAARAFPIFAPQPKLTDEHPLMAVLLPNGPPALRPAGRARMGWVSLALAAAGLGILRLTRPANARETPSPGGTEEKEAPGALIEFEDVSMRFGRVRALDGVSLTIAHGQAVALWGPNGAGKTTLLRCLLGLLPYRGAVRVGGHDARRRGKQARRLIGFVPQELRFHDDLSVRETLAFYGQIRKAGRAECQAVAERLELADQLRTKVAALSGGMKQRLALAVALLGDPPILLLDEPTANLDLHSREGFLRLLQRLKSEGKTLVFCSHHLDEVMGACERIVMLEQGRLSADCPPDELDRYLR